MHILIDHARVEVPLSRPVDNTRRALDAGGVRGRSDVDLNGRAFRWRTWTAEEVPTQTARIAAVLSVLRGSKQYTRILVSKAWAFIFEMQHVNVLP